MRVADRTFLFKETVNIDNVAEKEIVGFRVFWGYCLSHVD